MRSAGSCAPPEVGAEVPRRHRPTWLSPGADQSNPVLIRLLAAGWTRFRVAAPRLSPATTWGPSRSPPANLVVANRPRGLTRDKRRPIAPDKVCGQGWRGTRHLRQPLTACLEHPDRGAVPGQCCVPPRPAMGGGPAVTRGSAGDLVLTRRTASTSSEQAMNMMHKLARRIKGSSSPCRSQKGTEQRF